MIHKEKNEKAVRTLGLVSEMVKSAEEAEVDVVTKLINQILVKGVISEEW